MYFFKIKRGFMINQREKSKLLMVLLLVIILRGFVDFYQDTQQRAGHWFPFELFIDSNINIYYLFGSVLSSIIGIGNRAS